MEFKPLSIADVVLIKPKKIGDDRGYFMETFRQSLFEQHAGTIEFKQENQSLSAYTGTVRGLHFQIAPRAQGKLVRCIAGAIFDVAVDIRVGSPTYGLYVAAELSAQNGHQLWIPAGFAHGFCTLQPSTEVSYKVTDYYSPDHDRGLRWDDPAIGIEWPDVAGGTILSAKDKAQPLLAELKESFSYGTGQAELQR
ncbi:dTDP-4-dehydrorhamnose 3,5-epimerase [Rhizobium giardinii]|uniref:dTDP-4-dehydrorhamnose 3,5-epimerase n=1 Tax=Rhizobium giardinii TaxID=56731 RepID=A0A7W8XCC1_9HYPH|nr:dTDP-4-dehydrorhamnose 3,5-epimerase [Rhizobium giardinii]MBB5539646.1 dTDP-4-dehydrorhamnose 3,5-epimerase [Rhizobium giardinii]